MKKILNRFGIFAYFIALPCFAQVDLANILQPEEGKPINIKSENLVIKNKEDLAIFTKNVRVTQGAMTLKSEEMQLYTTYDETTKKSRFKRIEAEGNVDFKSADKSVQSDKAVYDLVAGKVTLTGNVHMKDAQASLEGKTFVYDVKSGRSELRNPPSAKPAGAKTSSGSSSGSTSSGAAAADSGSGRARVIFVPGEGTKEVRMPTDIMNDIKTEKSPEEKEKERQKQKQQGKEPGKQIKLKTN